MSLSEKIVNLLGGVTRAPKIPKPPNPFGGQWKRVVQTEWVQVAGPKELKHCLWARKVLENTMVGQEEERLAAEIDETSELLVKIKDNVSHIIQARDRYDVHKKPKANPLFAERRRTRIQNRLSLLKNLQSRLHNLNVVKSEVKEAIQRCTAASQKPASSKAPEEPEIWKQASTLVARIVERHLKYLCGRVAECESYSARIESKSAELDGLRTDPEAQEKRTSLGKELAQLRQEYERKHKKVASLISGKNLALGIYTRFHRACPRIRNRLHLLALEELAKAEKDNRRNSKAVRSSKAALKMIEGIVADLNVGDSLSMMRALLEGKEPAQQKGARPPRSRVNGKLIIIDGTNVLRSYNPANQCDFAALLALFCELAARSISFVCVFDASTRYTIEKLAPRPRPGRDAFNAKLQYEKRLKQAPHVLQEVPGGSSADSFILARAEKENCPVLTNDRYRDQVPKYPWLVDEDERLFKGRVMSGWLIVPALDMCCQVRMAGELIRVLEHLLVSQKK